MTVRSMGLLSVIVAGACGGCLGTSEPGVASRDPAKRVEAMVDAAATKDESAVPGLVARLDSQDPGERLVAINALKRITGETLGYDHAAPAAERDAAIERWRARIQPKGSGGGAGPNPGR